MAVSRRLIAIWTLLLLAFVALQYRLWLGEGSFVEMWQLDQRIASQKEENARLQARNQRLAAEVIALRSAETALEERARSQLGMVHPDETLFLFVGDARQ